MSWLEQFAITIILGILQQVIKDPAKKAELQNLLVGLANDIYESYGMSPPAPPTPAPITTPTT
jgi:hypothetical protein